MPIPSDTTFDAEQVQLRLLRAKLPSERGSLAVRLSAEVIRAAKRAIARRNPKLTESQIGQQFVELHYGQQVADAGRRCEVRTRMSEASELIQALRPVLDELNRLGVRYYIGGSVASSIHGAARSTLDVD